MFKRRDVLLALIAISSLGAPAAWGAGGPPIGVYSCYDATMSFSPISGSQLKITPTPVAMFGVIDGTSYADWNGHLGHYAYDVATGTLTMTDGSREGWRYRKTAAWSFTLIDNHSGKEIYTCPLETAKNPSHGPW